MLRVSRSWLCGLVVLVMIAGVAVLSPPTPAFAAPFLIDSYSESNYDGASGLNPGWISAYGQSFEATAGVLDYAQFHLLRYDVPTGPVVAELWATAGIHGTCMVGAGQLPLTRSYSVQASTITSTAPGEIVTFDFPDSFSLSPGAHYVILVRCEFWGVGGIMVGEDSSSPTHSGNMCGISRETDVPTWYAIPSQDMIFSVYAKPIPTIVNQRADATPVKLNVATEFHADVTPLAAASELTYTMHFQQRKKIKGRWNWIQREDLNCVMTADSAGILSATQTFAKVGTWRMYITAPSGSNYGKVETVPTEFTVSRR